MTNGCTETEAGTVGEAVGHRLDRGVMAQVPKRAELLRVVPCSLRQAQKFVTSLHRHHKDQPLPGHKLSLGLQRGLAQP